MILRQTENETCKECGHITKIGEVIFGCDNCGQEIPNDNIMVTNVYVISDDYDTDAIYTCSWKCTLEKLRGIDVSFADFIDIPSIGSNGTNSDMKHFLETINDK